MYANQSINLCQSEVSIVACVHVARVYAQQLADPLG